MNKGGVLAAILMITTLLLVGIGTLWPVPSAVAYAGGEGLLQTSATAEAAVQRLGDEIRSQAWEKAYSSLANQSEFTETEFIHDITGYYPSLRTYATLDTFEAQPMHESEDAADYQVNFHWSTVVGTSLSKRDVHVVKVGDRWEAEWPIVKEASVPPQVIPVTFLRWDVIYRGPGDDWGSQDVDAPHVRIVDMHAVQRASGVVVLGELLNEDVVPAYVSVSATLLSKDQSPISTEDSFDKISHLLLPKQVTPFLINFPDEVLSKVSSIRMAPISNLVSASADPVIEIENEHLNPSPDASLSGELTNLSGQVVNVTHVLGTFYDKAGQVVWVADEYIDRALLPQSPAQFQIHIPEDLAKNISSQRTVIATYSIAGTQ